MLAKVSVDDVLARVDSLPTLPGVALRVGELINDPRAGAREVAREMEQDPSISAKLLRLVNSSYYAIQGGVSTVPHAISLIGFNTLQQLVLSVSVFKILKTDTGKGFDARGLWMHSLAVGVCADVIARRLRRPDPGSYFTAGMLHDIGKIALASTELERFKEAFEIAKKGGVPMCVAETHVGLPPHDRVGGRLARRWKFPAQLVAPIEHHHEAGAPQTRRELLPALLDILDTVAMSNEICRFYGLGDGGSPQPDRFDEALLHRLGLVPRDIEPIHDDLIRKLEHSKIFLDLLDDPKDARSQLRAVKSKGS